jgi:hypothetical protein
MNISLSFVSFVPVIALSLGVNAAAFGAAGQQETSPVLFPRGIIVMWSGSMEEIPLGWSLCDGTKGTPDLRDRFVIGAGTSRHIGIRGGSYNHSHKQESHTHRVTLPRVRTNVVRIPYGQRDNLGSHSYKTYRQRDYAGSQTFNSSTATAKKQTARHLPPYFKIAFIMKN